MEPNIKEAIGLIERQINAHLERVEKLKQAKKTLIEESNSNGAERPVSQSSSFNYENTGTRKDQVVSLLKVEGRLSRNEILEKTGLPIGTISYVLNDKNLFSHSHGKWFLKPNKQSG